MRYLTTDRPVYESGYRVEDGIYVEPDIPSREFEVVLSQPQTAFERRAEEARWAARSGPCRVIRPASTHRERSAA